MNVLAALPASRTERIRYLLLVLLLVYGLVCGLRTVVDFDLGWQIADARHPLSSVDTLSYTAAGATWVYPPLAGVIFRSLFLFGGYPAISWFCALMLLATLAVTAWRGRQVSLLLLLFAVPVLARQMIPRSGIFTVLFAAVFTRLLLAHLFESRNKRLWLLPVVMLAWVNLHTGFIAGLGLMLGYLLAESIELLRAHDRAQGTARLRRASPWLALTALATLLNPWGPGIYAAIAAQERVTTLQSSIVLELVPLYREFYWSRFHPFTSLDGIWWLLAVAAVAVALLLRRGRFGAACFVAFAAAVCLMSARTEGVFVPIACLGAGYALDGFALPARLSRLRRFAFRPAPFALAALVLFVGWRSFAVVTDRTSLAERQITLFGAGPSWWLPTRAVEFIEQNHLPHELFSNFNLSSYLTWRLGPAYRDFADGRYLPFGDRLVSEQMQLEAAPLDSEAWTRAVARRHIGTVILPLSRFYGIESVPLRADCASSNWTAVYFDTRAIVFVRNDAMPSTRLAAMRVDCVHRQLVPGSDARSGRRAQMERYQELANAAVLYFLLGRYSDAEDALQRAWQITTADDSMMLLSGQLNAARGDMPRAESFFRAALHMRESNAAWYQLGIVYASSARYPQAIDAFRRALKLAGQPDFAVELALGKAQVLNQQPDAALATLSTATGRLLINDTEAATELADADDVEAAAFAQSMNWQAAIASEEDAVRRTPAAAVRWQMLAGMYSAAGRQEDALKAEQRADALAAGGATK